MAGSDAKVVVDRLYDLVASTSAELAGGLGLLVGAHKHKLKFEYLVDGLTVVQTWTKYLPTGSLLYMV